MADEQVLRKHLQKILDWEDAHASFDRAVDGIPVSLRGRTPEGWPHSAWQLLEHLRICQKDILDFCVDPKYAERHEYWPASASPPTKQAWNDSVAAVRRDRDAMKRLAADRSIDLFAKVPNGTGQTYLRELLLVADHNAYHVGQLVALRRALGDWKA